VETTNKFYSIVDESHMTWTKNAMDEMLKNNRTGNHLDTGWTLAREYSKKAGTEEIKSPKRPSVNPAITSTSDTAGKSG
jgi:hypothetical protein